MIGSSIVKQFVADLRSKWTYDLTEQECIEGIENVCAFFCIPVPVLIQNVTEHPDLGTCVMNRNQETLEDDILYFDLNQLKSMGVSDQMGFMAVMTHECAHRVFQNHWFPGPDMGQWESELVADYFMGVKIGLEGWDIGPVIKALENVPGSGTHPTGKLRGEYVKYGRFEAHRHLIQRRNGTIKEYLDLFYSYLQNHYDELHKAEMTIY